MGFGFGGSSARSHSSSQSTSLDIGADYSSSFSDSLAQSLSESQGTSTQAVWNADLLQQLYSGALGAAGNVNTGLFQGQAQQLYQSGMGILDSLGVGAGDDYLQSRLTDTSARDAQLGALKTGLGDLFRDELNPAITGRAVATGTLGGGRQGVAQGAAANAIAKQYATGAADIIGRDQLARDAAAGMLNQSQINRATAGTSALGSILETASAGLGAPLSPYSALSGILGGPTVLTQSQQTSRATSEEIAQAISEAFGFNFGTSQSTSSSKSKSASFNVGVGS
jgi:hypothetical protein